MMDQMCLFLIKWCLFGLIRLMTTAWCVSCPLTAPMMKESTLFFSTLTSPYSTARTWSLRSPRSLYLVLGSTKRIKYRTVIKTRGTLKAHQWENVNMWKNGGIDNGCVNREREIVGGGGSFKWMGFMPQHFKPSGKHKKTNRNIELSRMSESRNTITNALVHKKRIIMSLKKHFYAKLDNVEKYKIQTKT